MQMNDTQRERVNGTFSSRSMRVFLDGGEEASRLRDMAHLLIQRDPMLSYKAGHNYDLTQPEAREKTMIQIRRIGEMKRSNMDRDLVMAVMHGLTELSDSFSMRIGVHGLLFKAALSFFGTDEQRDALLPLVEDYRIFGSFAMTELGHSSSLRDIETTATFDPVTDEFVLLSPTITSTKWWMGMVGETATHTGKLLFSRIRVTNATETVLLAQTIINGASIGLNWFVTPLRDRSTGRLLPGVACGDLGAKAGRHGLDNGWIQVTGARVPRTAMLSRWCQVSRDGSVEGPASPVIMYATLIPERLTLTFSVKTSVGKALTIACRYAVARRQGDRNQQIIEYQAVQHALLPSLAGLYVFRCIEASVMGHWDALVVISKEDPDAYMQALPDIHATSAGLKAVITWWASDVLELCRRSVGGHAYSAYNGIAGIIADWGVMTTGGGDNTPMAQQCARYVLFCLGVGLEGGEVKGSGAYLGKAKALGEKVVASKKGDFEDVELYVRLFSSIVVRMGKRLLAKIALDKEGGRNPWNQNMVELIELAHWHIQVYILMQFQAKLKTLPANSDIIAPLRLCGALYSADVARRKGSAVGIMEGSFTSDQAAGVRDAVVAMCEKMRSDVITYTDGWSFKCFDAIIYMGYISAFGFPDFILMSPIGVASGDIYNAYFDTVKRANTNHVSPYFESQISPLFSAPKL
ncbi:acyl-Coenzyme A oxidase [Irineochytrium annulatum]|nr:acyl-Coenzyme A oxidase [Irineochytrium annulatum]